MPITPHKDQQEYIDKGHTRRLLSFDTGAGKTILSLLLAEKFKANALIIVPKKIKQKWIKEAELVNPNNQHFIVTKEEFKRDYKTIPRYEFFCIDESHYFSNPKSAITKSAMAYVTKHQPLYRFLMTATPYLSSPWNMLAQAEILGLKGQVPTFRDYMTFMRSYFFQVNIGMKTVWKPNPKAIPQLMDDCKVFTTTLSLNEIDPSIHHNNPQTESVTTLEYSKDQIQMMEELEDTFYGNALTISMYEHQIEQGLIPSNEYGELLLPRLFDFLDPKTEYLEEQLKLQEKEHDIAIICHYNKQLDHYASYFEGRTDREIIQIRGKSKLDPNEIKNNPNRKLILIQAACSEGYELPDVKLVYFASLNFSYKDYKQIKGRFLRRNKPSLTNFVHIQMESPSIDRAVYKNISRKQDFTWRLYGGKV